MDIQEQAIYEDFDSEEDIEQFKHWADMQRSLNDAKKDEKPLDFLLQVYRL